MVYEPLYHGQEMATIKLSAGYSCTAKSVRSSNISRWFFIKLLFHLRLLDMRWLWPTRCYTPRWLSIISYPTRARGIIVDYTLCDWLANSRHFLDQPMRSNKKTKRYLLARVFPLLAIVTCICLAFSLIRASYFLLNYYCFSVTIKEEQFLKIKGVCYILW